MTAVAAMPLFSPCVLGVPVRTMQWDAHPCSRAQQSAAQSRAEPAPSLSVAVSDAGDGRWFYSLLRFLLEVKLGQSQKGGTQGNGRQTRAEKDSE